MIPFLAASLGFLGEDADFGAYISLPRIWIYIHTIKGISYHPRVLFIDIMSDARAAAEARRAKILAKNNVRLMMAKGDGVPVISR